MKHALLAFAIGLSACASAPGATSSNPLIGSWELLQYVDTPQGGAPAHAFGDPPVGLFVFTADGRVSISFMRNPPRPEDVSIDKDPDACIPMWYCSYFGTYTPDPVDGPGGSGWTARVIGGNIPSYIGTEQHRIYALADGVMTIAESYVVDGVTFSAKRVLRKVVR
jgi:hypothetical protein